MSFAENLGNLKDQHGDKINEGVDKLQEQHGDKLGERGDQVNQAVDAGQEKFLGGQKEGEQEEQQGN